jgi:hypothetical protein
MARHRCGGPRHRRYFEWYPTISRDWRRLIASMTGSSAPSPPRRLARSFDHSPPSLPHRSSPASAAPIANAGEEPADPAEQVLQPHLGGVEHWLLGAGDMDSSQTTQRAESLLADVSAEAATAVKGIRFEQGPGARDHEKAPVTLYPKSDRCRPIRHQVTGFPAGPRSLLCRAQRARLADGRSPPGRAAFGTGPEIRAEGSRDRQHPAFLPPGRRLQRRPHAEPTRMVYLCASREPATR